MYEYKAKLVRCVDGDTVDFDIDLGFAVFVRARTRLVDVDTPERGQKDYKEATEFLKNLIVNLILHKIHLNLFNIRFSQNL